MQEKQAKIDQNWVVESICFKNLLKVRLCCIMLRISGFITHANVCNLITRVSAPTRVTCHHLRQQPIHNVTGVGPHVLGSRRTGHGRTLRHSRYVGATWRKFLGRGGVTRVSNPRQRHWSRRSDTWRRTATTVQLGVVTITRVHVCVGLPETEKLVLLYLGCPHGNNISLRRRECRENLNTI